MRLSDIQEDQYHEIEYRFRGRGVAQGEPETMVIAGNPKDWRHRHCGEAVLLSSKPITFEQYMMRTLTGEAILDGYM